MTEEKTPDKAPEVVAKTETIDVDIDGIQVKVDLETGKRLIEARQKVKKEVSSLKEAVARAEQQAKSESDRAALLKAMKDSDVETVKATVAAEYIEKIAAYENKIFNSEIKSLLANEGTLPTALDDAANLALHGAKVELKDNKVLVNDKPADEYVKEFIKTRPHLVSVKTTGRKEAPAQPAKDTGFEKFALGLFNKK